jgi:hypothetical protein
VKNEQKIVKKSCGFLFWKKNYVVFFIWDQRKMKNSVLFQQKLNKN